MYKGTAELGYNWQWYRVPHFLFTLEDGFIPGPLLKGLWVTVKITFFSLILTVFFGFIVALFRMSGSFTANMLARIYLETIRNTPLLIQLLFNYFVLSPILNISSFWTAIITLALFEGAYASEIIRAGIISIDHGQWEAGRSIGLSKKQTYFLVIIPQALRMILPPLISQSVALIKDSALVSTIAIYDLTMQGQSIISETFLTFEIWFTIAGIYLVLALMITGIINLFKPANQHSNI
ncbi:MAG: amino acid ABC transporter permease [Thermodesulfobacteriota bacterium]